MKKILFGIFIVAFLVVGLSNQSWAMGKRRSSGAGQGSEHHSGGTNGGVQSDNDQQAGTFNHKYDDDKDDENSNDNSFVQRNSPSNEVDEQFPAATVVPEPTTLALMGMGLAGIFMKRKKS